MNDPYGKFQDLAGKTIREVQELRSTNGETGSIILVFTDGTEVQIHASAETNLWRED